MRAPESKNVSFEYNFVFEYSAQPDQPEPVRRIMWPAL